MICPYCNFSTLYYALATIDYLLFRPRSGLTDLCAIKSYCLAMNDTLTLPTPSMKMRDMLFGDLPMTQWPAGDAAEIPWEQFRQARIYKELGQDAEAGSLLQMILNAPELESRHYLQAWHFLRQGGMTLDFPVELYGMVVEVAMEEGLDLLAIYADGSARYYNYSGSGIVWDMPDEEVGRKINAILEQGRKILQHIGPWEGDRPPAPATGKARINLLTSHGLYFGEAPQMALFNDPLAGPTMYAMLDMMQTLMRRTQPAN